jgi:hypothetical protein
MRGPIPTEPASLVYRFIGLHFIVYSYRIEETDTHHNSKGDIAD